MFGAISSSDWEMSDSALEPTSLYTNRLNTFLSVREGDDLSVRFEYAARHEIRSTFVHVSRMEWAGGPFRAMVRPGFAEQRSKVVSLSEDDDPEAFSVIRDFLYAKSISLCAISFPVLLRAARAAHRWQLIPLFRGILDFIENDNLLRDPDALLESVDLFSLPGVPREVLLYFWHRVGIYFGYLYTEHAKVKSDESRNPIKGECAVSSESVSENENLEAFCGEARDNAGASRVQVEESSSEDDDSLAKNSGLGKIAMSTGTDSAVSSPSSQVEAVDKCDAVVNALDSETKVTAWAKKTLPIEARLCPRLPNLWALALSHDMVEIALQNILCYWTGFDCLLLDVVLQYLEPRIKEDGVVCRLIAQLSRKSEILETKLEEPSLDRECTSRAVRLLAKTMNGSRFGRQEMRYSWRLALAEEQNFVRDVFFCPDFPVDSNVAYRDVTDVASKMLGSMNSTEPGVRKRSRPSKYELLSQSSVRVTLSVGCDSDEAVVLVCWKPGIVFEDCESTLAVLVEIMDDNCVCAGNDARYPESRGCLGRAMSTTEICEKGLVTVRLEDELLDAYRNAHGPNCAVTISLLVKLLPS